MMKNAKFLVALLIFLLFIVSTFANRTTSNIKLNDHIYIHSVLLNNENSLEIMDILGMIEKTIIKNFYKWILFCPTKGLQKRVRKHQGHVFPRKLLLALYKK